MPGRASRKSAFKQRHERTYFACVPSRAPQPKPAPQPSSAGWRKWAGRFALMLLAPALMLVTLEAGLRLFGFGYRTSFFVPMDSGARYTSNERYVWQFYSSRNSSRPFLFSMPAKKPPGAIRIFVLGESAAMGTPDPAFSFGRLLEVMLQRRYPDIQFEVINAAMRGINSHVLRLIARDCARHEPDLFVVYMGNNEVIGLHGPKPNSWRLTQNRALLRGAQWIKSTKVGQCFRSAIKGAGSPSPAETQSIEYFRQHRLAADDWRRQAVRDHFRANLEDICQAAGRARAKVILSTVAVNLKDCPPLGSLHRADLGEPERGRWEEAYARGTKAEADERPGEAIQYYLAAARIDDHFAELHFRLARCELAAGTVTEAQKHFALARDWDALQFRTDSRLNDIIRKVGAEKGAGGVTVVDAERAFAESALSDHGIVGANLFHEHVHPTFDGDYLLAKSVYPAVVSALGKRLGPPPPGASELPSRQDCAETLAFTVWDEINVAAAMRDLTAGAPFTDQVDHFQRHSELELRIKNRLASFRDEDIQRALQTYGRAIKQRPEDWKLRFNLGSFFQALGQHTAAAEQFQFPVKMFPDTQPFRLALGNALAQAGRRGLALQQFAAALRLNPKDTKAQQMMAWARTLKEGPQAGAPAKIPRAAPGVTAASED